MFLPSAIRFPITYSNHAKPWPEYMEKRKIQPPVITKWIQNIQTPPRIYDYVAWVAVHNPSKIGSPKFAGGNRGSLSFFTHTHTGIQTNSFISPTDHKYGRIWNIYGSKRVVSRTDVPFGGNVDDKSCLGVQIPQKTFLETIPCKTYYRESSP